MRTKLRGLEYQLKYWGGPFSPSDPFTLQSQIKDTIDQIETKQAELDSKPLNYSPIPKARPEFMAILPEERNAGAAYRAPTLAAAPVTVTLIPDASVWRSGFSGVSSTNGASYAPGMSSVTTSFGGLAAVDMTGLLGLAPGQRFMAMAGVWADHTSVNAQASGASPANTLGSNGATFAFAIQYGFSDSYVNALVLADTARNTAGITGIGPVASFGSHAVVGSFSAGHLFALWAAPRATVSELVAPGWKILTLDLSGRIGNASVRANSFVDAFGQFNGVSGADNWSFGASGRLSALYNAYPWSLIPYVRAALDVSPGAKFWTTSPLFPLVSTTPSAVYPADRLTATFEGGLDVRMPIGATLGSSVFYSPGTYSRTVGGRLSLKIPLM